MSYQEEYIREALAWGWYCRACGAFTGDEKKFHVECRCCGHPRPRVEHVVRGTRGKR
jgi:rRNA maturation endonuclease Nob1